jgi:hypothetical protein
VANWSLPAPHHLLPARQAPNPPHPHAPQHLPRTGDSQPRPYSAPLFLASMHVRQTTASRSCVSNTATLKKTYCGFTNLSRSSNISISCKYLRIDAKSSFIHNRISNFYPYLNAPYGSRTTFISPLPRVTHHIVSTYTQFPNHLPSTSCPSPQKPFFCTI